MSQEVLQIDPDKFIDANRDYIDRIEREGIYAVYDSTLDTLFVEFGGPKEALSEHAVDNLMIRIDPQTLHIVGFEILDLLSDFLPHNRLFEELVRDLGLTKGKDSEVTLMEPRFKPLKDVIEALIPHMAESIGAQRRTAR